MVADTFSGSRSAGLVGTGWASGAPAAMASAGSRDMGTRIGRPWRVVCGTAGGGGGTGAAGAAGWYAEGCGTAGRGTDGRLSVASDGIGPEEAADQAGAPDMVA